MSLNDPLVSVLLPAFNAERYFNATLRSVTGQSYPELEILIVDDGSKDGTWEIASEIARTDGRIRLFRQSNLGVAAARNLAICHARGKYVAPIDADDLWVPSKIEQQVRALEASPQAGVCYGWSLSIDSEGRYLGGGPHWDLEGDVFEALVLRNFIGNASVPMFRRDLLLAAGGYDPELRRKNAEGCEDWDVCLRLAAQSEFRVVKHYLVCYRQHERGMSFNHDAMGRSYHLVIDGIRRGHPEIPSEVFRWSKSLFYLYLSNRCSLTGDVRNATRWLVRAAREDAAVLLIPWVDGALLKGALRAVSAPMLTLVWNKEAAWKPLRPYQLAGREDWDIWSPAFESRAPKRLWDKIQVRRWARITNQRSFSCC